MATECGSKSVDMNTVQLGPSFLRAQRVHHYSSRGIFLWGPHHIKSGSNLESSFRETRMVTLTRRFSVENERVWFVSCLLRYIRREASTVTSPCVFGLTRTKFFRKGDWM